MKAIKCLIIFMISLGAMAENNKHSEIDIVDVDFTITDKKKLKRDADRWGLSVKEWMKYLEIKKGPRGVWSPNLDPLAMLALEAETDKEMRYYATLYAHMQDIRIQNELKVDRYRREAVQQLYKDRKTFIANLLDKDKKDSNKFMFNNGELRTGDKLLLFVDASLTPKALIQRIQNKVFDVTGLTLDIYLLRINTDNEIRTWAKESGVNVKLVRQKKITLNYENNMLDQLSKDNSSLQLFMERNGKIKRVREESVF